MAKITLTKKYFHDYNNPTEFNKYNIEHDQSGSIETIEVDSVEELLKRVLTEHISQGYDIRNFEMRFEKGTKNTEEWIVNSEMVKIKAAVV